MKPIRIACWTFSCVMLFVLIATGTNANYGYQHEPNNSFEQAEWLPVFSYGWHSCSGTVSQSDPSDYYFFLCRHFPHPYKLHLYNQSGGDIDLWLYNGATGGALWASAQNGSMDEELSGTLTGSNQNGWFIAEAKWHSGGGDLSYTIENLSGEEFIPLGPSEGSNREGWLKYDSRLGSGNPEDVSDMVRVHLGPVRDYLEVTGAPDATLYTVLWPIDEYLNVNYSGYVASDFGGFAPGQSLTMDVKGLPEGDYAWEVGIWDGAGETSRYVMFNHGITDNNDDCSEAQTIDLTGIAGQTTGPYDGEDWYKFDLGPGYCRLKVTMLADNPAIDSLRIFNSCSSASLDWFDAPWVGTPEVSVNNPPAGTYYLEVQQNQGGFVTYGLEITTSNEDCTNDTTPPDTLLTGCPYPESLPSDTTSHSFGVGGRDNCAQVDELTYQWALYKDHNMVNGWTNESWIIVALSNLTPGWYDFYVRAVDKAGNKDQSPAYCGFMIGGGPAIVTMPTMAERLREFLDIGILLNPCSNDTEAPDTSIANCPYPTSLPSTTTSYTFNVSGSDPNDCTPAPQLIYQWSLYRDSAMINGWTDDDAAIDLTGLVPGWYDFYVRAVDSAGNKDATQAYCGFQIAQGNPCANDTTAPDTWINNCPYPASLPSSTTQYTFNVGGSDDCTPAGQLTYQWSFYRGGVMVNGWTNDDTTIEVTGLTPAWYDLHVRAVDSAGNKDLSQAYCGFQVVQ